MHQNLVSRAQHCVKHCGDSGHAGWEQHRLGIFQNAYLRFDTFDCWISIARIEMAAVRISWQQECRTRHDRKRYWCTLGKVAGAVVQQF